MLRLGIVGLPNVGKSTLFNALTSAGALVANYPFATIEPNTGVVQVPDPRLDALAGIVTPERTVPAAVEFVDIAGLVKGASQGEGLGNQFLANIREVDAIVHVVRCFEDPRRAARDAAGRSGARPRDHQHRAGPRRPRQRGEAARQDGPHRQDPATRRPGWSSGCSSRLRDALAAGKPGPRGRADRGRAPRLSVVQPPHRQAGALRRQRRRGRDRQRQRATPRRSGPPSSGTGRARRSSPSPPRSRRSSPSWRRRTGRTFLDSLGVTRIGPRPAGPRRLSPARPAELLHRGREGGAGLDHPPGRQGARGGRGDPLRFREGLHPGRDRGVRGFRAGRRMEAGAGAGTVAGRGQGVRGAGRRRHAVPVL